MLAILRIAGPPPDKPGDRPGVVRKRGLDANDSPVVTIPSGQGDATVAYGEKGLVAREGRVGASWGVGSPRPPN